MLETLFIAKLDDGCEFRMTGFAVEPKVIERWQVGIEWIERPHGLRGKFAKTQLKEKA